MTIMVFDLETIPDLEGGRQLLDLADASEDEVYSALVAKRRAQTNGSEFMPLHLQKIVAISVVVRSQDWVKVWSLGDAQSTEAELLERFYAGLLRYTPTLVSWNGGGFDLPVLHYRSLIHGVSAGKYWEAGDKHPDFKWNNYLNRYHNRHLDLMDVLAAYQGRAVAPLHEIAILLGFPGKFGLKGDMVFETFKSGGIEEIRNYCEGDVLNTYLIYLRFQLMRSQLERADYQTESELLKEFLKASGKPHLEQFLAAWQGIAQGRASDG